MPRQSLIPAFCLVALAAGCGGIGQAAFESPPVQVSTPAGVVTCQLYTEDTVLWDRAIDVPPGMSIQAGDEICVEEGRRRAAAG